MMHRMRIGELLVEQRKLRQSDLTRALAEATPGKRLCSILIKRGLVDYDDAARALGEQRGVPCALAKHLAGRDPKLASLIPGELGRSSFALPSKRFTRLRSGSRPARPITAVVTASTTNSSIIVAR
jgi:hypothetical protein